MIERRKSTSRPKRESFHDRLTFALIGFIAGALLAAVLWFLYGLGFSGLTRPYGIGGGLWSWIVYGGGFFAIVGFIFKDRVGDAIGDTVRGVYEAEAGNDVLGIPNWLLALIAIVVMLAVWYFTS